jgi:predicted Rossmann fold flavoprotein
MQIVLVVGGGASGMMAAITAAEDSQNRVILIEKQSRVGRKLLATGNGCCNLTNADLDVSYYFGEDRLFVKPALDYFGLEATLDFFRSLGLITRTEPSGRVYPYSMQANSVLDVLRFSLERPNIELRCDTEALSIKREGAGFVTQTSTGTIKSDKLIVTAGGAAAPKLGGTMSGYKLLEALGHSRTALYPSLVQVKTDNTYTRALKGIKAEARVMVQRGGKAVCTSTGEVLFTEYGLSGPAVFEVSRHASTEKDLVISLDLMPGYEEKEVAAILFERKISGAGRSCEDFLTGILNKRLGQTVLKYADIALSQPISALKDGQLFKIARSIKSFNITVMGTTGFENAQVTAGGIRTSEFDSHTLESKICPGLYAAGEVLDVDGCCGGYNLQWAWSSGRLSGRLGNI